MFNTVRIPVKPPEVSYKLRVTMLSRQTKYRRVLNEYQLTKVKVHYNITSVSDPSHFDVDPDPDPGIHIWEKWIRILGSTFP